MKKMFASKKKKEDELATGVQALDVHEDATDTSDPSGEPRLDSGGLVSVRVVKGKNLQVPNLPGSKVICIIEYDKNEMTIEAGNEDAHNPFFKSRAHFDVARQDADLVFSVWIKGSDGSQVYLGSHRLRPLLVEGKLYDNWLAITNDNGDNTGELEVQTTFKKPDRNKKMCIEDFDLLKVIGKGSFGKVMQVRKKDTGRIYAMKIIRKANIVERDEVDHTIAERNVLAQINHPFIVNLKFSFQTSDKLYLVLAFVNGGELFKHLQDEGQFDEARSKFYAAELLLALEHLHTYDIVYRDLKPENILLDSNGHIALCDFGLCKLHMSNGKKTNTFCGTPEYLAPELLLAEGYTKCVDWWTLGVLLFEMLTGLPPFYSEDINEMYQKILHAELVFPPEVSPLAKNILVKLLNRNPGERLGANGAEEIKKDPFFADVNWSKLMARKAIPPFRPDVISTTDTSNFDEEFTTMAPVDSVVEDSNLSDSVQQQFEGFTYVADNKMTYAATPQMSLRTLPKNF